MPKQSARAFRSPPALPLDPDDLTLAIEAELAALAEIDADYAEEFQLLEHGLVPRMSTSTGLNRLRPCINMTGSRMCSVWPSRTSKGWRWPSSPCSARSIDRRLAGEAEAISGA
jgi:hypothetical protein